MLTAKYFASILVSILQVFCKACQCIFYTSPTHCPEKQSNLHRISNSREGSLSKALREFTYQIPITSWKMHSFNLAFFYSRAFFTQELNGSPCLNKKYSFRSGNYMFKGNNRNPRIRCYMCSKLAIKKPEGSQWGRSGFFIAHVEHI